MKNTRPEPICSTCKQQGGVDYQPGGDAFRCPNCGTEMRYLPAGELWNPGEKTKNKNSGWLTTFAQHNTDLSGHKMTVVVGTATFILSCVFLIFGKIDLEAAALTAGSGIILAAIGRKKTMKLKKKINDTKKNFPFWHR
ncbi:MAG: hypothetical protein GQ559_05600 [Desulfobulbaceae bacterium]|nr:hypothetical protein [Desulfobulbaceae bacterium]